MFEYADSAYLPPLSLILEYRPIDLSLAIDPQETLLIDGQSLQEAVPEQNQSQLGDLIYYMHEWSYGSDASSSCHTVEETFGASYQESFEFTEENNLYENIYTLTTEEIRQSDTSPCAPPLLRDASILSLFDNLPPPICYITNLDISNEVVEPDEETMLVWERSMSVGEVLSEEDILSEEKVIALMPREPKEVKQPKRTRKNYSADTIDILMNWYLEHDGVIPTKSQKKTLASRTGKSEEQVTAWFQNAKRRYAHKLKKYKELNLEYPEAVHDYRSFKSFSKLKK